MQTVGAAGAVAIAGCLGDEPRAGSSLNGTAETGEPELDGLPTAEPVDVDREFYVGQHELYTDGETGGDGHHGYDFDATADEDPTVGEIVRIYFASGGPNLTSTLYPIGSDGDLLSEAGQNVETAPVAPGTATAGEMECRVPGPVKLVDHALSRVVRKRMLGVIDVQGAANPEIYDEDP